VNFKEVIDMQSIPIASIRIENRLRPLDSAKVAELAASIAELGLLQPIGIRPDGTLVYGYHRLEACKQLGWTEIPAVVVDGDDLIITDPPYPAEYVPLFGDLARIAAELLKPSGVLIAYSGQAHLIEGLTALASHLRYWWTLALRHQHAGYVVNGGRRVINRWKPLLLFTRKDGCAPAEFADLVEGTGREKELHVWQQAAGELGYLLETFTRAGDLVIDPFVGSGTTAVACLQLGRRFIGCDIDAGAVAIARRRVQDALKGGEQP
jgi:hypothetical protein